MKFKAFTLAELLIAMAILGVIAAFSIPKVLVSQQEEKKKAVFKETISTLSGFLNNGLYNEYLSNSTNELAMRQALFANMNFGTIVDLNIYSSALTGVPNACWGSSVQAIRGWYGRMHNGACVAPYTPTWDGSSQQAFIIAVDWNGPDGPNTFGQDWLAVCMGITNHSSAWCPNVRKGEVSLAAGPYGYAQTLWDSIWK